MTAEQLASYVGAKGEATIHIRKNGEIRIPVVVMDVRQHFGRVEFHCRPEIPGDQPGAAVIRRGAVWLTKRKVVLGK